MILLRTRSPTIVLVDRLVLRGLLLERSTFEAASTKAKFDDGDTLLLCLGLTEESDSAFIFGSGVMVKVGAVLSGARCLLYGKLGKSWSPGRSGYALRLEAMTALCFAEADVCKGLFDLLT